MFLENDFPEDRDGAYVGSCLYSAGMKLLDDFSRCDSLCFLFPPGKAYAVGDPDKIDSGLHQEINHLIGVSSVHVSQQFAILGRKSGSPVRSQRFLGFDRAAIKARKANRSGFKPTWQGRLL